MSIWLSVPVAAVEHLPTYTLITLTMPENWQHQAGQYTVLRYPTGSSSRGEVYYSIASSDDQLPSLEICANRTENPQLIGFFDSLKPGDQLELREAQTAVFADNPLYKAAMLVGGGSGIAPLRSLIQKAWLDKGAPGPFHVIYGGRDFKNMPFLGDLKEISQDARFRFFLCTEDSNSQPPAGWASQDIFQGPVTAAFEKAYLPEARYYICGPRKMVAASRENLIQRGVFVPTIISE